MNRQGNLVALSQSAYASMVGADGRFPGAELMGLADGVRTTPAREDGCDPIGLALRLTWATQHKLAGSARSAADDGPAWRALELGAGSGGLAQYIASLGHKLRPGRQIDLTLVEPVLEQNVALIKSLTALRANEAIAHGAALHRTFAEFQLGRERDGSAYDLVVLVYALAGLLAEEPGGEGSVSTAVLCRLISLLAQDGLLVIADRTIHADAPNEIRLALGDVPKLLRWLIEVLRAGAFFRLSPRALVSLAWDRRWGLPDGCLRKRAATPSDVRIQREPGWQALDTVHQAAACRGQQLERLISTLRQLAFVGYRVVDFVGNWVLLIGRGDTFAAAA